MNILQRAVSWTAQAIGASGPPTDPMDPRWWGLDVIGSLAGQAVTSESGLQLGVVQAVLERLGGTTSTLPLMVFERTGPNGENRRPARNHPLFRLLHAHPNARQTAQEFRDEQARHLAWFRNAYAILRPAENGYPIGSLDQVHPARVMDVWRAGDGRVYYKIQRLAPAQGADVFRDDEIWHVRRAPLTDDGLRGRPVYQTARETLGRAQAVEQFGALFFANGGAGGGVLEHPGTFSNKEQKDLFLETWRSAGGGANQHKDRMLLNGVKYNRNPVNNDEAQFLETKREMKYEVAAIWNMPGHMVGLLDRATFTNIEHQSTEYAVHTIAPLLNALEQSAERDLLIGPDQDRYFVEHNVAGLLRGDFQTRWTGYSLGRQWGWLSVNDIRRLENLDPIGAAGDVYITPLNMAPAGSAQPSADENPQDPEDLEDERDAA